MNRQISFDNISKASRPGLDENELRRVFHHAHARTPANWRRAIWLTQADTAAASAP